MVPGTISTGRLDLVPLPTAVARLLIENDRRSVEEIGIRLPEDFPSSRDRSGFLSIQLDRMERFPDRRDWLARMILDAGGNFVGHCGFHGPPEEIRRAEIGYTVFRSYRGRGYAKEAAGALARWAFKQAAPEVYASISPANEPSLAVVRALGFEQVGIQEDVEDGTELVFVVRPQSLRLNPPPS